MSDNKNFSLWISTVPANDDGTVSESDMMYLGSAGSLPLSISYTSSTTGILGYPPSSAIFVDGTGGAVLKMNVSAIRANPENPNDSRPNNYSNKKFIEKLVEMRSKMQMTQNAYVLKVYNSTIMSDRDYDGSSRSIRNKREELRDARTKFVFIDSFDIELELDSPNVINVTLNLIERNLLVGYNE